jgi:hypothetical protein
LENPGFPDADCQAAGIEKTDPRGRVVDIHALPTTFCTHVAVAGVHPRVAQQAMRHSRMELTNQYYTDPILLDVAGAVNSLPDFAGSQETAHSKLAASSRPDRPATPVCTTANEPGRYFR